MKSKNSIVLKVFLLTLVSIILLIKNGETELLKTRLEKCQINLHESSKRPKEYSRQAFITQVSLLRKVHVCLTYFGHRAYSLGVDLCQAKRYNLSHEAEEHNSTLQAFYMIYHDIQRLYDVMENLQVTHKFLMVKKKLEDLETSLKRAKIKLQILINGNYMRGDRKQFLDRYINDDKSIRNRELYKGLVMSKTDRFRYNILTAAREQSRGNVLLFLRFTMRMMASVGFGATLEGVGDFLQAGTSLSKRVKADLWVKNFRMLMETIAKEAQLCVNTPEFTQMMKNTFKSSFEDALHLARNIDKGMKINRDMISIAPHLGFAIWVSGLNDLKIDVDWAFLTNTKLKMALNHSDYDFMVHIAAFSYIKGQQTSMIEKNDKIKEVTDLTATCSKWPDVKFHAKAIAVRLLTPNITAVFVASLKTKLYTKAPEGSIASMGVGGLACFNKVQFSFQIFG